MPTFSRPLCRLVLGTTFVLSAGFFATAPARADVTYTNEMKMGDLPTSQDQSDSSTGKSGSIRMTTQVKDMRERVDTSFQFGPMLQHTVRITQCDTHQQYTLDTDLKIYTVEPIGVMNFGFPMSKRPGDKKMEGKPGEGKIITTLTAQNLGTEKIGELTTHHSMLTVREQSSGCIGESDSTNKLEVWTAPIKTLNCPERLAPSRVVQNERGCQITHEMHGDLAQFKTIFTGMIVQMKFYSPDGKVLGSSSLREYSQAKLDDDLFAAPTDFKEVSQEDFTKAQQKAMMQKMMHGSFGNMGNLGGLGNLFGKHKSNDDNQ